MFLAHSGWCRRRTTLTSADRFVDFPAGGCSSTMFFHDFLFFQIKPFLPSKCLFFYAFQCFSARTADSVRHTLVETLAAG